MNAPQRNAGAETTPTDADREVLLDRLRTVDAELGLAIAEHRLAQFHIQEVGTLLRHRRVSISGALELLWQGGVDHLVLPGTAGQAGDTGGKAA